MRKDLSKDKIRIGTRGSKLALIQTETVIQTLRQRYPDITCETVIIKTVGDKILDKPLQEIGGKGLFISEFEDALLQGEIDLAIHSAKDMPVQLPEGLDILGVLKREDPRDVLITVSSKGSGDKPAPVLGTSSLRRQFQIAAIYEHAECRPLRGNVDTRLRKLAEGEYDGIILAAAGIKRMQLDREDRFSYRYLTVEEMIPAAGQGIIAIEGRKDSEVRALLGAITDPAAELELSLERRALELFSADCHEPVGIYANVRENLVTLWMMRQQNGKLIKKTGSTALADRWKLLEAMVKQIQEEID